MVGDISFWQLVVAIALGIVASRVVMELVLCVVAGVALAWVWLTNGR